MQRSCWLCALEFQVTANKLGCLSAAGDDIPTLTITALMRLAVDSQGRGPSAGAIRTYVADGLIKAARDSTGRLLFRPSDAKLALQVYESRTRRHGRTGKR
jgi:hypothetical protein